MKKILIYEANSNQALAISKYLKNYSNYYIVGAVEVEQRFSRKSYHKIIIQNFLDIDIKEYDYSLPMGAGSSFEMVSKYKSLNYCNSIFFTKNNLIVFDKPQMLETANKLTVPIPKTYYKKEKIEAFPIFYKESFENGGGVRGVANSLIEIPNYDNLIYQEFISTPSTYGVGFIAKDGKILTYTLHKEVISFPIEGGSSVVIESFEDKRVLAYTQKLLQKIDYNGWGLAEFKYCEKREDFIFMEINGKFWASIEFMLTNNPVFLNLLLDVEYRKQDIKRLLFINRFFHYSLGDVIKNIDYLFSSTIVIEHSLVYQIFRKWIPNRLVAYIKNYIQ